MSIKMKPIVSSEPCPPLNLSQLRDLVLADAGLDQRRRGEAASALRCLAKALRQPMETIAANPEQLRKRLAAYTPAMAGLSPGRWRNIRSLLQFALEHAGIVTVPGRYRQAPSVHWNALLTLLTAYGDRYRLGRLGRYCTSAGVEPEAIDDTVLSAFLEDFQTHSLVAEPRRVHRDVIIAWNRNLAAHRGWPQRQLSVPDNRHRYAIPWSTFPASLKADVEAWLDRLAGRNPMVEWDFRPLRAASLRTRERQMHLFISALVIRGQDPAALLTLADVVTPERVAQGLRYFWERAGNRASVHSGRIAGLLLSTAKHWVGADQEALDRLKKIAHRIRPRESGMTLRNRERLRPLDDPKRLQEFLTLPQRIRAEVCRGGKPTRSLALAMQTAVMVELLILIPMRILNLANLQLGVHLLCGRRGEMTLVLEENEVKNRMPMEAPLPASTVEMLNVYVSRYRPLLANGGSAWLFPGRSAGGNKGCEGLRQQIQKCLRTRCGLRFHPHLFRHAAARLMLSNNPGAHGQVQRVLGHKTISTTLKYYSGMETTAALEHYDAQVLMLRGEACAPGTKMPYRRNRP